MMLHNMLTVRVNSEATVWCVPMALGHIACLSSSSMQLDLGTLNMVLIIIKP